MGIIKSVSSFFAPIFGVDDKMARIRAKASYPLRLISGEDLSREGLNMSHYVEALILIKRNEVHGYHFSDPASTTYITAVSKVISALIKALRHDSLFFDEASGSRIITLSNFCSPVQFAEILEVRMNLFNGESLDNVDAAKQNLIRQVSQKYFMDNGYETAIGNIDRKGDNPEKVKVVLKRIADMKSALEKRGADFSQCDTSIN